jgi:hypothetical protein
MAAAALACALASPAALAGDPAPMPTPTHPAIAYEPGTEVTFSSKDPATELYLAHGDVPVGAMPDPFERVGLTPLTIKLAAGTYSVETAGPTQSAGHERFMVEQGRPLHIEVRPGDANVKTFGTVIAGLGVVSVILGVVAILSFSPNDSHYDRFGIGLPLILGGAAGCGIGVGMTALGATAVRVDHQPLPAPRAALVPTLRIAF